MCQVCGVKLCCMFFFDMGAMHNIPVLVSPIASRHRKAGLRDCDFPYELIGLF